MSELEPVSSPVLPLLPGTKQFTVLPDTLYSLLKRVKATTDIFQYFTNNLSPSKECITHIVVRAGPKPVGATQIPIVDELLRNKEGKWSIQNVLQDHEVNEQDAKKTKELLVVMTRQARLRFKICSTTATFLEKRLYRRGLTNENIETTAQVAMYG